MGNTFISCKYAFVENKKEYSLSLKCADYQSIWIGNKFSTSRQHLFDFKYDFVGKWFMAGITRQMGNTFVSCKYPFVGNKRQ